MRYQQREKRSCKGTACVGFDSIVRAITRQLRNDPSLSLFAPAPSKKSRRPPNSGVKRKRGTPIKKKENLGISTMRTDKSTSQLRKARKRRESRSQSGALLSRSRRSSKALRLRQKPPFPSKLSPTLFILRKYTSLSLCLGHLQNENNRLRNSLKIKKKRHAAKTDR